MMAEPLSTSTTEESKAEQEGGENAEAAPERDEEVAINGEAQTPRENAEEEEKSESSAGNGNTREANVEEEALELTQEELDTVLRSECIAGDVDFYHQIMGMMGGSLTEKLAEMRRDPENTEVMWKCAHSIKGTALQCSLDKLAKSAKDLERAYRNPEKDDIKRRGDFSKMFEREAQRVLNSVQRLPQGAD